MAGSGIAAAQEPSPPGTPPAPSAPAPPPDSPVITVTGRVIDALGRPVEGATVGVEGGTETTRTDREGKFQISAAIGASLVIERDGYDPALANVTATQVDDVVMLAAGSHAETIEVTGEAPPASPGAAEL
ncbi:MAG TPA: carboxypeptidase regulatory-like domain-containing protein, partial [Kofleriaceae bacterium]|nr:carboxypeptidase regulatory-like domain-containing protein [Kofleriaceae bacterium]